MDSPAVSFPDKLVFTFQEEEATAYSRLVWARRDRGPSLDSFMAMMIAIIFAIGFGVMFANHLGFVTSSQLKPVLFTAYAAFFAGALAHRAAIKARYRAIARAMFRDSGKATDPFEVVFDASGVAYNNTKYHVRVPWAAVAEVIETSLIVVLLFEPSQGFPIPVRLFSDPASRANFIAAMRERASGARRQL